jgi:hypothetical protein
VPRSGSCPNACAFEVTQPRLRKRYARLGMQPYTQRSFLQTVCWLLGQEHGDGTSRGLLRQQEAAFSFGDACNRAVIIVPDVTELIISWMSCIAEACPRHGEWVLSIQFNRWGVQKARPVHFVYLGSLLASFLAAMILVLHAYA